MSDLFWHTVTGPPGGWSTSTQDVTYERLLALQAKFQALPKLPGDPDCLVMTDHLFACLRRQFPAASPLEAFHLTGLPVYTAPTAAEALLRYQELERDGKRPYLVTEDPHVRSSQVPRRRDSPHAQQP